MRLLSPQLKPLHRHRARLAHALDRERRVDLERAADARVAPGRSDATRASIPSEVGTARREPSKRRNRDVSLSIAVS